MSIYKGKNKDTLMYYPLLVPSKPWDSIIMEFILGLPKTERNHDSILVVVDRCSNMAHSIPCFKTSDATHIKKLIFKDVKRLHGLPKSIIFDRDTRFVGISRDIVEEVGEKFEF